ncbi:MAG: alpha/beta fold hydrolase [Candidatus Heimdallarchaeota archaeon]
MKAIESFDGNKIYYSEEGHGDICLLFIHGLGANRKVWKHQKTLSSKYKLVFIDLAGHGKSDRTREVYTMQSFAKDVKAVVNKLIFRKLFLIGWSMGGAVMLEAEKLVSDHVIGLIGVDTLNTISSLGPSVYIKMDATQITQFLKSFSENFTESMTNLYKSFIPENTAVSDVTNLLSDIQDLDPRAMLSTFEELFKWDFRDLINEIKTPVRCIMAGEYYDTGELREEYEKHFKAVFMENVKHMLFWEEPSKFNNLLEEQIQLILGSKPNF